MQVTLQHHSSTRKSIKVTIPAAEVNAEFRKVLEKMGPKVKIPGFRPGKVPKQVLLFRFAQEIQKEVAESLVNRHFLNAAQSAGTQPISQPALEKAELREGADGTFSVHFDVAPEVALPEYKGLVLIKKKRIIDAAAIDEHLEDMRQQAAKLVPIEEAAANGHYITLDIKVKPQGMKAQAISDQVLQIQADRPFDKELLGMKVDEHKKFSLQVPDEDSNKAMAGKNVAYEVTVKDLRARIVPELNDEFAKDMGDYSNMQALRESLQKELEEASDRDGIVRLHTTILETLLNATSFEVPSSMVALQLDDYCNEFASSLAQQGVDPHRVNWKTYRQKRMFEAERAVRSGYLLQALGNAEDIQVSDEEVDNEIQHIYEERKVKQAFAAFKAEVERRGAVMEIKGRIRTEKIFERLISFSTIQEERLDKAAYEALVELERRRDAGIPQARFDAGGLEGGGLEDQEGGAPSLVTSVDEAEAVLPEAEAETVSSTKEKTEATSVAKPKKTAAKKVDDEEKPAKTGTKKAEKDDEKPAKKVTKKSV